MDRLGRFSPRRHRPPLGLVRNPNALGADSSGRIPSPRFQLRGLLGFDGSSRGSEPVELATSPRLASATILSGFASTPFESVLYFPPRFRERTSRLVRVGTGRCRWWCCDWSSGPHLIAIHRRHTEMRRPPDPQISKLSSHGSPSTHKSKRIPFQFSPPLVLRRRLVAVDRLNHPDIPFHPRAPIPQQSTYKYCEHTTKKRSE